jgi:hypothetical protein
MVKRTAGILLAAALLVICVFALLVNASCWYHRRQAERALRILQSMPPGKTPEKIFLEQTKSFRTRDNGVTSGGAQSAAEGSFAIDNLPHWNLTVLWRFEGRLWPLATSFWVVPQFRGGELIEMEISEMQGSGHPFGAHVRWGEVAQTDQDWQQSFRGYRVSQWDGDGVPPWGYIVTMDDRATAAERNHALDLKFQCFTRLRRCQDARLFLRPVGNQF